jgi:hypothetical protein
MPGRADRQRLADTSTGTAHITVTEGPVATTVRVEGTFVAGKPIVQTIRFCDESPRIDYEVTVEDLPNSTTVLAEVPLADEVSQARRGIPYGFSEGAWAVKNPTLPGIADGIQPAIRWSDYQFVGGGGLAILDRGLPGRELVGNTPVIFFLDAQDQYMGYPGGWLSGKGAHTAEFALVPHRGDFREARVARLAYEYNAPPIVLEGAAAAEPTSFLRTSGNVIVEALRREGGEIELRLVECLGQAGTARVTLGLPHKGAWLSDLRGRHLQPLAGGPSYQFPVRPQEIVTIRFGAPKAVPEIEALTKWDELVPPAKLAALRRWLPDRLGHPPMGSGVPADQMPELPRDAGESLTLDRPASASNVYQGASQHAAGMAVDCDRGTRWATDTGLHQATLEADLGEPKLIGRAYLSEAYDRVRRFELQYERDGQWVPFARGERIGKDLTMAFEPVTARKVRLAILDSTEGPTIWEFLLFGVK